MRVFLCFLCVLFFSLNAYGANYVISIPHDADSDPFLVKALAEAKKSRWKQARRFAAKSKYMSFGNNMIILLGMLNSPSTISIDEARKLLTANRWLPKKLLIDKFEKRLYPSENQTALLQWFKSYPPQTNFGHLVYMNLRLLRKKSLLNDKAFMLSFRKYWRTTELSAEQETYFLSKYRRYFSGNDFLYKINLYLWADKHTRARQLAKYLKKKHSTRLEAQIKYSRMSASRRVRAYKSLPQALKEEDFIKYLYGKALLNVSSKKCAISHMVNANIAAKDYSAKRLWKLNNYLLRDAIDIKMYNSAYKLSINHNLPYGEDMTDAYWLSGWIALSFLKHPETAMPHFENLYKQTHYGISQSKSAYWLGRTYEALKDRKNALHWYRKAAVYNGLFYGQLSIAKLKDRKYITLHKYRKEPSLHATKGGMRKQAWNLSMLAYIFHKSGHKFASKNILAHIVDSGASHDVLVDVANDFVSKMDFVLAVELAKVAANRGLPIIKAGYPSVKIKRRKYPRAFYLAIIRQESSFDKFAASPAGAKGLMQIMPSTAAILAKRLGLPKKAYAYDPQANVVKGVTHLDDLKTRLNSYVMAIAAYNAGQANAKKWSKINGHPCNMKTQWQMINWIEKIPYRETRGYVKKVIENFVIYNTLLNEDNDPSFILKILSK